MRNEHEGPRAAGDNGPATETGQPGDMGNEETPDSLWLQAFRAILERDDINGETDFFQAGGYSLLVPQLMSLYESLSGWRPPIRMIFEFSSPVELEAATKTRNRRPPAVNIYRELKMAKYKFTAEEADRISKHGIDLTIYGQHDPSATVSYVNVDRGHFQEFFNIRSSYTYYIVSGAGTFYLNGEAVTVAATDLIMAPPGTRTHYLGTMKMVLTVAPAFDERDERHVRFISESKSP